MLMRRRIPFFLAVLLFAQLLVAKDKPTIQKLIVNARFVLVTTYFGDEPANPRIVPEDRQAVANVQNAIEKWAKYALVYERKNADLIIVVRTGRLAQVGVRAGSTAKPAIDGDAGDPRDILAVYDAAQGIDSPALWIQRESGGLKAPELPLLKDFQDRVEAAAKQP
jgi:hypothetical protein